MVDKCNDDTKKQMSSNLIMSFNKWLADMKKKNGALFTFFNIVKPYLAFVLFGVWYFLYASVSATGNYISMLDYLLVAASVLMFYTAYKFAPGTDFFIRKFAIALSIFAFVVSVGWIVICIIF